MKGEYRARYRLRGRLVPTIEPVAFRQCRECGQWFTVVDRRDTIYCNVNCRDRHNLRAWRARKASA